MPLIDSGSALFAGTSREFATMAPASALTAHLEAAFRERWGGVSASEIRSWRNSLASLASVVTAIGLDRAGTGVELKLPLNSRRIDAFFTGRSRSGRDSVVLVELKQWDTAAPSRFPDNVVVGEAERLHPSVQAASYAEYLRASHSAFTGFDMALSPCAYLHNMRREDAAGIRGIRYEGAIADAPFFVADEEAELAALLDREVSQGDGMELLPRVTHGEYRPSRKLLETLKRSIEDSSMWTLLDEQRLAFNIVRGLAERAATSGAKAAVIVTGGPGTGKSVIALHLLVSLGQREGRIVAHATGSKAFTTNLRALVRGGSALFRYFNNFMPASTSENAVEVLVCDEAHRVRTTSNDRFTRKDRRSHLSQVEELLRAARVSVFFLDQRQNVRPGEIGSVAVIEKSAIEAGIPVHKVALDSQFRCSGCRDYIEWVDALMSAAPTPTGAWRDAGEYDLRSFDRPEELERAVLAAAGSGHSARLVAGFCWPWSDPDSSGTLVPDVVIDDWRRPWNEKSPEQRKPAGAAPAPGRHPYFLWATQPERVREVGCIYSAQGFEFDYCGVILGNDLVWRSGTGWVANRDASRDPSIARRRLSQEALRDLLQHSYRVLLTRGIKGTYLTSTDWETQDMLRGLLHARR